MKKVITTSTFGSGTSEFFVYESENPSTQRVILILKGIYGYHFELNDFQTDLIGLNWDSAFIRYFLSDSHVICINTSRIDHFDQSDGSERKKSFEGKSFVEEVSDIKQCFSEAKEYLESKGWSIRHTHFIGKSFGGTLFLGIQDMLQEVTSVTIIGSGCGKSPTTTKPLLSTMLDEDTLLQTIRNYRGYLSSFRGSLDTAVPQESQEKIVAASGATVTNYIVFQGADHEFETLHDKASHVPLSFLRKSVRNHIETSETLILG